MSLFKEIVRHLIYLKKKKNYTSWLNEPYCRICPFEMMGNNDFYFGYYDKSPERNGKVLLHEMQNGYVTIALYDLVEKKVQLISNSNSYNWQIGSRALWIDDNTISYNLFEDEQYVSKWVSVSDGEIIKTIPLPTMDLWQKDYILAPNFQRLCSVDPHYSYCCLPKMDEKFFNDYEDDGIWIYDIRNEEKKLLLSITDILKCKLKLLYENGSHCVNHIMIAPDGNSFIFIHRYLYKGKKFDRLMYYDFKELKCLHDDPLQSHFCWLDNHTVMGYCGYDGKIGWFQTDTKTGHVFELMELSKAHPKNGHPTAHGNWIVIDSYPDLSRMQTLHAYNRRTKEIVKLAEFFHDMKHHDYDRCDLHPRFSNDGESIYIDTLYSGKRQLCKLNVDLK